MVGVPRCGLWELGGALALLIGCSRFATTTILESEGARWEDLVDITVFLTDMQRDFQTFNRIYRAHFEGMDPALRPCRTTVEVGALPTPIAVELKCVAHCPR